MVKTQHSCQHNVLATYYPPVQWQCDKDNVLATNVAITDRTQLHRIEELTALLSNSAALWSLLHINTSHLNMCNGSASWKQEKDKFLPSKDAPRNGYNKTNRIDCETPLLLLKRIKIISNDCCLLLLKVNLCQAKLTKHEIGLQMTTLHLIPPKL